MKILQLSWSLYSGGAERFVVDLSNRLAEYQNADVLLVTIGDDNIIGNKHYFNSLSKKIRYQNLRCKSGKFPQYYLRVCEIIHKEKPDIVHAHCGIQWLYLPAMLFPRVKFIYTLHNVADVCLKSKWLKPWDKWMYTHRIVPVTISKTCKSSYERVFGLNNELCITNGREPLEPSGIKPKDINFIKDKSVPVFIHVARCHPQKNQVRLFKTFERLKEENVEFHLIVLGVGYENRWMEKYKGDSQIHIIGERNNVADYMCFADFFVLTSDYEGLPLTLLEAMSLGVVPICTPAGGIVDVIHDGVNGYLTKGFSDEEFYETVKKALAERGRISPDKVIEDYRNHYSMKTCAEKYYKAYLNAINGYKD